MKVYLDDERVTPDGWTRVYWHSALSAAGISAAKNSVPGDASEAMINVMHDGKPEQFKLAAAPEESDPSGKSYRSAITHEHDNDRAH